MRVEIPFGKNKRVSGIVYELHDEKPDNYQIKPIIKNIDDSPIIHDNMLALWKWMAQYYCCTLGEIMQAALPAFLKLSSENVLAWSEDNPPIPDSLDDATFALAEFIQRKKEVTMSEVHDLKFFGQIGHAIDTLLSLQLIEIKESTNSSYKPKLSKHVSLSPLFDTEEGLEEIFMKVSKAPKLQSTVLQLLQIKRQLPLLTTKDIQEKYLIKSEQLSSLEKRDIIQFTYKTVDRVQLNQSVFNTKTVQLSPEQSQAKEMIQTYWDSDMNVVLLKGVTGSGKTMLYIDIIKDYIAKGHQVLLLLPEIALTQHIISKLEPYFGEELGIYHSKYSNNERVEIWNNVKNQKYKIIVGARSSLWLPFQNLGCIIVDEEHDPSYKQKDPAPRFNARDAAIQYASICGAQVLLGSATPSFESYNNARQKKFGYVELNAKYNQSETSRFEIINNNTTIAALSTLIAYPILEKIDQTIQSGQQVIVFQNRRGYAPILMCHDCHTVCKCHHCDVSLTYHKLTHRLNCHYCGQSYQLIQYCTQCGSSKLSIKGFGTEKIEEELSKIFSKYKVSRLDLDTVKGKNAHIHVINDFEKGLSQILVGTQMVVKGLDFENVGLVVILNADALLYYPDFRVQERAFQLLVQVAGRTGRQGQAGHIMIQTSNPQHQIYKYVTQNSYDELFKEEMFIRKALIYPPFCRLIQIVVKHVDDEKCAQAINLLKSKIDNLTLNIVINGPSPSVVKRVRNKYSYEMLIKCPSNSKELQYIKSEIIACIQATKSTKSFSSIQTIIDVDPY